MASVRASHGEQVLAVAQSVPAGQVPESPVLVVRARFSEVGHELVTVFLATLVNRTLGRMLIPSARQAMTCPRRSVESLFIGRIPW
jgi:hypothetical protein